MAPRGAAAVLSAAAAVAPAAAEYPPSPLNCSERYGGRMPAPLSWHVHVVFGLTKWQIAESTALRDRAIEEFKHLTGPDCPTRFDNGHLCFVYDHKIDENIAVGPFPSGEWSMYVPVHYFNRVVPWFQWNRGRFSVLVHPNTGCEYEDHVTWPLWAGPVWPLDVEEVERFNEYNTSLPGVNSSAGLGNPTCVAKGGVCGDRGAPEIVCCAGSPCACGAGEVCRCG